MSNGKVKNWVMIGLLAVIIVVLLTQPIIVTSVNLNAWTTSDGTWQISDIEIIDGDVDTTYDQYLPSVSGDIITWSEIIPYEDGYSHVKYRNMDTGVIDYVQYNENYTQWFSDTDGERIVYDCDLDSYLNPIEVPHLYMKELDTGIITQISNGTGEVRGVISGDYIAYADVLSVDNLFIYNLNDASTINVVGATGVHYIVTDGNYIAYSTAWNALYYYDIENDDLVALESGGCTVDSISDGIIGYTQFDYVFGDFLGKTYNILTHDKLTIQDSTLEECRLADVQLYGDSMLLRVYDYTTFWSQIAIVDTNIDYWSENLTRVTNDAYYKVNLCANEKYAVWQQFQSLGGGGGGGSRANSPTEIDVVFVTYERIVEEDVPIPDVGTQESYNYDVIYTVIILSTLLAGAFALWLNEKRSDWDYGA